MFRNKYIKKIGENFGKVFWPADTFKFRFLDLITKPVYRATLLQHIGPVSGIKTGVF